MYKRIALISAAALLVIAAFMLTPFAGQTGLFSLFFASPSYSIDSLSVYQSDGNVIGSGTAVCTGIGISGISASCDTNLTKNGIYRFELVISNNGSQNGYPDQAMLLNAYAAGDILGSDANLLYCGCLDDGTYKKGIPSFVTDDLNCNLALLADKCMIEKTSGSEIFYYVIGIGSNPATGTGSFYINDQEKNANDLSAEVSFGYCIPACDSNAGCADSNSLTIDACSNPGTCSAACSHTPCTIACDSNASCNDSNSSTTDACLNAGTCTAACSNTPIACTIACSSDAACADSNSLTIDACLLPETCSSSCTHTLCSIACSSNAACADTNSLTIDTCSSPGTCSAACSHSACTPACYSNTDCNDSSALTTDICNNAGTCDANCSNSACVPACNSDLDCDDADPDTRDTCIHPGDCGAHCMSDYCAPECSSDEDCGDGNPLTIDTCSNAGDCEATCSNTQCPIACSSDSDCDDSKLATEDSCSSPGTCLAKCAYADQKDFVFVFSDFNAVGRGNFVDLNVLVKDMNGNPIEGVSIYFIDSSGNRIDLNGIGSGYYFGSYEIPADFALGEQTLSFLASKGELVGVEELVLEIAKGNVNALLLEPYEPKAIVGEKLQITFALVYGNGDLIEGGNATASMNGISIPLTVDSNGFFTGYYLFSEADLGGAVLTVVSSDALGNEGSTSISFSVQQPLPLFTILAGILVIIAVLVAAYGLKRTHKLSSLLRRAGKLESEAKATKLQHSIEKEKGAREKLAGKIEAQEKELVKVRQEADFERKKQALAVSKVPMESKYAVHKAAVGFSAKFKGLFSRQEKTGPEPETEARLKEIDSKIEGLQDQVRNLETEYCKQTIKEGFFRKKLFDYREKIHLLELEKKKIE